MKKTNEQITHMMTTLQLNDESDDKVNKEERLKCADFLCETINNMTLHFNEKGNRCRYSTHTVNLSLMLCLRNKNVYK